VFDFGIRYMYDEEWYVYHPEKVKQVVAQALREAVAHRHFVYMPLHFTEAAYHRYPDVYKPRSNYWRRGLHQKSRIPLYDTGGTKALWYSTTHISQGHTGDLGTATAKSEFTTPARLYYIRQYGYDPSGELAATNNPEWRKMVQIVSDFFQASIRDHTPQMRELRI
jgi:hypothetical protein